MKLVLIFFLFVLGGCGPTCYSEATRAHERRLEWLSQRDYGTLKMKSALATEANRYKRALRKCHGKSIHNRSG